MPSRRVISSRGSAARRSCKESRVVRLTCRQTIGSPSSCASNPRSRICENGTIETVSRTGTSVEPFAGRGIASSSRTYVTAPSTITTSLLPSCRSMANGCLPWMIDCTASAGDSSSSCIKEMVNKKKPLRSGKGFGIQFQSTLTAKRNTLGAATNRADAK